MRFSAIFAAVMMKRITLYLLFCCLYAFAFTATAQPFVYAKDYNRILEESRNPSGKLYYPTLLQRYRAQDRQLTVKEMLALMIGYTGRPGFKPYRELETEKEMTRLNNSQQYKAAIALSDSFLDRHPLNQAVLLEKAFAFYQLKEEDSANFYKEQFGRIMAAMDWSNTGRSPEEAIFAIGPHDGRNFIDKYYRADLGQSGAAEDKEGNFCDMLEMKFKKEGKTQSAVLYFAIQHAVNTTAKPKSPDRPGKP